MMSTAGDQCTYSQHTDEEDAVDVDVDVVCKGLFPRSDKWI